MIVSGKLRRICKCINAGAGTRLSVRWAIKRLYCAAKCQLPVADWLYTQIIAAYSTLRLNDQQRLDIAPRSQDRTPEAAWWIEPPPGARPRSLVPERSLLRCPRSGAGEVRDASTGPSGGGREDPGGVPLRDVAPDVLPGRSGLCAGGPCGATTEAARPEGAPQADTRGHGVHRGGDDGRCAARGAHFGARDPRQARPRRPPSEHRTRAGAEKKTVSPRASLTVSPAAVAIYEALRSDVLRGHARPDGVGAIVYHGLVHGLSLLSQPIPGSAPPVATVLSSPNVQTDPQFLHLLANMVLRTHREVSHVY